MFCLSNRDSRWPVLLAAASFCIAVPGVALAQGPYHVITQWKIGGEGGWDYTRRGRQGVSSLHHARSTRGSARQRQRKSSWRHHRAAGHARRGSGPSGKYGYISDGRANAVVVFDRSTLKTVTSIPAGTNPDGIAYEPVTQNGMGLQRAQQQRDCD